jgi:hypothetical protein
LIGPAALQQIEVRHRCAIKLQIKDNRMAQRRAILLSVSRQRLWKREKTDELLGCIELHYILYSIAALLYVDGVVEDF